MNDYRYKHLVDVDRVRLLPLALLLFLVAFDHGLTGLTRLDSSLSRGFWWHCNAIN